MDTLEKTFKDLLLTIGKGYSEEELTALFPIKGAKYNQDLMVVGRAINGWGVNNMRWKRNEIPTDEIINNIINFSKEVDGKCPMAWIEAVWHKSNQSNPRKGRLGASAFWRVIKRIIIDLKKPEIEKGWTSNLVWTELYNIAPPNGGNPSEKLCDAQYDKGVKFLEQEILTFNPQRVLFLTGYNWFKDFEEGFKGNKTTNGLVEWTGKFNNVKVVVAKHPQGKNETKYVDEVLKAFNSL